MENQIKYVQLSADNKEECAVFENLMSDYVKELDEHGHKPMPEGFLQKWVDSIIEIQGQPDRHLELCYALGEPVGFLYGKVDREGQRGFIKPGWGYIMEFYVKPEHRRKGYGRAMFRRIERLFADDGAAMMYLTADPVTGRPFWEAMGFAATGKCSPENNLEIYEKSVLIFDIDAARLLPLSEKTAVEIGGWTYESPYEAYSFRGVADGWLMDRSGWGTEQFCLCDGDRVIGQVACQLDGGEMWVGWSMNPKLCGRGSGAGFVRKCVSEIRRVTGFEGCIKLRVAAWNRRAIRAYQKAGFAYVETILDEIAYSDRMEDFWVMELRGVGVMMGVGDIKI